MGENLKSPLSSINPASTHHSPGFLAWAQRKTVSEMNTLSPLIPLRRPALWERVLFLWNGVRGTLGFYRAMLFFCGIRFEALQPLLCSLRSLPRSFSFSSNPHQTCLTVWTRRRLLTRLQNSFICGLRRSNLDPIKQHTIDPLSEVAAVAAFHH